MPEKTNRMTANLYRYFLLSIFMSAVWLVTSNVSAQSNSFIYRNEEYNFSIIFPVSWDRQKDYQGTTISASSPKTDRNVNVVVEKIHTVESPQSYEKASLLLMKEYLHNFQIVEESPRIIGSEKVERLHYSHEINNVKLEVLAYFLVHESKGYVITCTARTEDFAKYQTELEKIASSFKFSK